MYQEGETASKSRTRLYNIWKMMRKRCRCETRSDYKYYGGKGIKVCEEWNNPEYGFEVFRFWAMRNGYKDYLTIDRLDTNGDYCPENCRWVTMRAQAYNRTNTVNYENAPIDPRMRTLTYKGETRTIPQWAKVTGINERTLRKRLKLGWTVRETLERPTNKKKAEKNT